jgi:hypothetical protein
MVLQIVNQQSLIYKGKFLASWPSGKARVCKTLIMGSNPIDASDKNGSPGTRFLINSSCLIGNSLYFNKLPVKSVSLMIFKTDLQKS